MDKTAEKMIFVAKTKQSVLVTYSDSSRKLIFLLQFFKLEVKSVVSAILCHFEIMHFHNIKLFTLLSEDLERLPIVTVNNLLRFIAYSFRAIVKLSLKNVWKGILFNLMRILNAFIGPNFYFIF